MRLDLKSLFKDILPVMEVAAPSIASAIGGPIGVGLGYILPILANAFNADPKNVAELAKNILKDPKAQEKLESIEHEHGDWLCTLLDTTSNLSSADISIKLSWDKKQG